MVQPSDWRDTNNSGRPNQRVRPSNETEVKMSLQSALTMCFRLESSTHETARSGLDGRQSVNSRVKRVGSREVSIGVSSPRCSVRSRFIQVKTN